MRFYGRLLIGLVRRSVRARGDLLIENLVLRQQLAEYARQRKRPRLRNEERLFWSGWPGQRWREAGATRGGSATGKFRLARHRLHTPGTESPTGSDNIQWCLQFLRLLREPLVGFRR